MKTATTEKSANGVIRKGLRQHRTKTIFWILHTSCLHLFRHIAQFVLARRQPCVVLIVQSDEKSDCAIRAQSLCGIALKQIAQNPEGIFLDYGSRNISLDALEECINKRMQWHNGFDVDIMVIQNGKITKVLRYKK